MIYTAGDLQNHFAAGLSIVGKNKYGELEWIGTDSEWMEYEALNNKD